MSVADKHESLSMMEVVIRLFTEWSNINLEMMLEVEHKLSISTDGASIAFNWKDNQPFQLDIFESLSIL